MKLFDYLNDILYKKKGDLLSKKDYSEDFQPYMIQRWVTMHSKLNAVICNMTVNKLHKAFNNEKWYKMFLCVIPKSKYKKIPYIKKVSSKKHYDANLESAIKLLAENKQISKRELKLYIENYGLNIDNIKKSISNK